MLTQQVEGAPLEICCLVDSDPMAAVTWYKNDLIFMDDARDEEDVAEIAHHIIAKLQEYHALCTFQMIAIGWPL